MIIDSSLMFADSESVTLTASTYQIGDVINLAANGSSASTMHPGADGASPMYFNFKVDTAFAAASTSTTVTVSLVSGDDNSDLTSATNTKTHITLPATAVSNLTAGTIFSVGLPVGDYYRYLGVEAVNSAEITAGAVSAWLSDIPSGSYIPAANTGF